MNTAVLTEAARAAGYIRVSQKPAAEKGYGLDAQEIEFHRHVEFMRWKPAELYREEGVSGYLRDRPALQRLLEDAAQGKFDVVIFPSIDRMARSVKGAIEIEKQLRKHGVDVVFMREGIDTSTPVGTFFRNVMASIAEFEGKLISERLHKGLAAKAAQGGYTGDWLAYGYRVVESQVVIVEEEAAVVRQLFEWRAEGRSLLWIKRRLDVEGVPPPRGKAWYRGSIRDMSRNRYYTGMRKYDGGWVPGQHPAIVSNDLFEMANSPDNTSASRRVPE